LPPFASTWSMKDCALFNGFSSRKTCNSAEQAGIHRYFYVVFSCT
jgi:hypothetical protein